MLQAEKSTSASSNCSTIRTGGRYLGGAEKLHATGNRTESSWLVAAQAAGTKQARNLVVLDVRASTSFTDYFVICSGTNSRQIQAIADEIEQRLKKQGEYPTSIEGYENAEWVLVDYGDFVVHIFSEKARTYYDLERLWRDSKTVKI
jgi:ribosome-associated protein